MSSIAPMGWVAAFLLGVGGAAMLGNAVLGQTALPPTSPTVLTAAPAGAGVSATPPAVASVPAASGAALSNAAHRASVVYSGGKLAISADGSSLNQILREVARDTGMKITGGVADEPVFGKYGPGAPADVLASLLEGTDSNMLLKQTPEKMPAELILTPRMGGPTPPNPNAPGYDDGYSANEQADRDARPPDPPLAVVTPQVAPAVDANGASTQKTPQEIYQQLQQMQQQQREANPR